MAARKQEFYVYAVTSGNAVLYVGKGSGRRHKQSARRFGAASTILEWCKTEDDAFERERHWIEELEPTENICRGGNGRRVTPVDPYAVPKALRGKVTAREWKRSLKAVEAEAAEIERVGSQKYCAQFLCQRLDESNCEQYGVSKVDLSRLREVAYG